MTSFSDSADTRLAGVSSSQTDQRSERAEASDGTGAATEAACGTEAPGRIRQRSNILQRLGAEVLIDCTQINSGNITMHLRRGIHDKEHLLGDVEVGISSSQALHCDRLSASISFVGRSVLLFTSYLYRHLQHYVGSITLATPP